jgi:hypothetical protein
MKLTRSSLEISIDESSMILGPVRAVYSRFKIPFEGLPIGTEWNMRDKSLKQSITLTATFPPCTAEVFDLDWVYLMCTRYYKGSIVSVPQKVEGSMPPGPCYGVGHVMEPVTLHRLQRVVEDLGCFEIRLLKRYIVLSEETVEDFQDAVYGRRGLRPLYSIRCIREVPSWYNDVIAEEGPT